MKRSRINSLDLFLIVSLGFTALYLLVLVIGKGYGAEWLVMENNFDYSFTDHFRHIAYTSDMKNFYFNTYDATFPAFAYLLYYLLWRINPNMWDVNGWKECRDYQYNVLVYVMLVLAVMLLFKLIVDKLLNETTSEKRFLFVLAIALSAPMMSGAIERGNISFLTAIMVLAAMYLKDSEKPVLREVALILIAMAAGLKLYPAIMGAVYLAEKRYKEAVRLVIYGLIVFLVPFAFCGGIAGLIQYLKILFFFENQGYRSWTNVRNYLLSVSDLFGLYEKSGSFVGIFKIIENLYLLICVVTCFKVKSNWKRGLYTAGIMALYVPYSYRYTAVYMVIPLVLFLQETLSGENPISYEKLYTALFALIFTVPAYGVFTGFDANFFIFTPIYVMMMFALVEDWILERKKKYTK